MLVLRGLLGDAMAMGLMAGGHGDAGAAQVVAHAAMQEAHSTHAAPAHRAPSVQPDALAMAHCASAEAPQSTASDCDNTQHAHCSACGICHSPLGAWASLNLPHAAPAQAAPMGSLPAFASAILAQVAKPPIS